MVWSYKATILTILSFIMIIFGTTILFKKFEKLALWTLKNITIIDKDGYMKLQGLHLIRFGVFILVVLIFLLAADPNKMSMVHLYIFFAYMLVDSIALRILSKKYID